MRREGKDIKGRGKEKERKGKKGRALCECWSWNSNPALADSRAHLLFLPPPTLVHFGPRLAVNLMQLSANTQS